MMWSPTGPTVAAGAVATRFVPVATLNLGGVARVWGGAAGGTFSLGGSGVTNTQLIPLAAGQDIIVAYGPEVTHIIASAADIAATPGIGRP